MSNQGRKNAYTCMKCKSRFVTVDKDDGVTPFMVGCRLIGCDGMAESAFYMIDQNETPAYEWYKPSVNELRGMSPAMADHVLKGGLSLRLVPLNKKVIKY